jgi:hypothetical protein
LGDNADAPHFVETLPRRATVFFCPWKHPLVWNRRLSRA